jgi:glycosyltransferase involved in cell wall biosynthesis
MTRLLIVSLNYAPEETGIAPYSTGLAEHLAQQGYAVTVLAGMPHYPAWRIDERYAGTRRSVEQRNGVRIIRRAHYVPSTMSAAGRAAYEASSLTMALDAMRLEPPHAVIGVVPSLSGGIVARAASARFGVPYGLIFQDLIGAAVEQSGLTRDRAGAAVATRLAALVSTALERWVAGGAAAVGVIGEGFRPYVERLGVDPSRIRRVRNWTHIDPPTVDRDDARARLGWLSDAIVCLHAGNLGYKQALENVIACARLAARTDRRFSFVFMGEGSQRRELERQAKDLALANVSFLPLQPAGAFSDILAAADLLLINQRGSVAEMSLPSKLTSYYAAGRPVVAAAAANSETGREIVASGGGLLVAPDDPVALLDGIRRVSGDPGLAAHLTASARTWAGTVLSKTSALRAYEQLVAAMLASGRRGRVHISGRRVVRMQNVARTDGAQASEGSPGRWAA